MPKKTTIHDIRFEAMIKLLKGARLQKGLTQEELSLRLGQHRIYINKVESGQRRLDVVELFDLCKELDISIYDLIHATLDNNPDKVMESSPDYVLGFSNGYMQGRGYETDKGLSARIISTTEGKTDKQKPTKEK